MDYPTKGIHEIKYSTKLNDFTVVYFTTQPLIVCVLFSENIASSRIWSAHVLGGNLNYMSGDMRFLCRLVIATWHIALHIGAAR